MCARLASHVLHLLAHVCVCACACSWACVEVPRYTFYAVNLFVDVVPLPLFFLRYNLFMVLYPSGISGEHGVVGCWGGHRGVLG